MIAGKKISTSSPLLDGTIVVCKVGGMKFTWLLLWLFWAPVVQAQVVDNESSLQTIPDFVTRWLESMGTGSVVAGWAANAVAVLIIGLFAYIANWLAKRFVLQVIDRVVARTPWEWDNALAHNKVFARLSHLAPAAVINVMGRGVFFGNEWLTTLINAAVMVYILIVLLLVISSVINTIQGYLERKTADQGIPVKGFAQAIKLVVFLIGGILILSVVFGRSPVYFLSGLGALTAVLLLVFRDALLGLVAGVMISANQLVRVGDWIEMPSSGADGDVVDVSLTTVKVRNWDRTITTIPSYDMISKSFKNWRGMYENQGRRIKRPILIDSQTIGFVDPATLERLLKIKRLRPYLESKLKEVEEANRMGDLDMSVLANGRRLTNLGTFRAYCLAYLREHPGILQRETMLVRQLNPDEHGLPLEIYAFTNVTGWGEYEAIQSDIFDHLFAIIGEFGLRAYQSPAGSDFQAAFQQRSAALSGSTSS